MIPFRGNGIGLPFLVVLFLNTTWLGLMWRLLANSNYELCYFL